MQFIPCQITKSGLDSLTKKAGQFIVVTDSKEMYLDISDTERVIISENAAVNQYSDSSSLPNPGQAGVIYITEDSNTLYRWNGNEYIAITSDSYTKSEIDAKFTTVDQNTSETRSWVLENYYNMDWINEHYYTKTQADTAIDNAKVDAYTKTESDNRYYTKTEIDNQIGDIVSLMEAL